MKLLNLGCGSNRKGGPWTNLDCLFPQFPANTPEGRQLLSEPNYIDHDIRSPLPLGDGTFDGILCSHVVEHFDCHEAAKLLQECWRVLAPGGVLVVSVPDAGYFLSVYDKDTPENAIEYFGEPIHDKWQPNFFSYALFHREHRQLLTLTTLQCLLLAAGFKWSNPFAMAKQLNPRVELDEIEALMNRRKFSLEVAAIKAF